MDGFVIASVIYELKKNILGSNINKISQPETDEILLLINKKKLLLSANACYPRICLLNEKKYKENPTTAPTFCMVLRKYILNARIISIEQVNFDRIIKFELEYISEFGDKSNYALVIEIMNKHSNIILLDKNEENIILDAIKHVDYKKSSRREILPGLEYKLICDENKFDLRKISDEKFVELIENNDYPEKIFNGFGNLVKQEINFRKKNNLSYQDIRKNILENRFVNQILFDEKNEPKYLSSLEIKSLYEYRKRNYESVFDAIEKFYCDKIKNNNLKQKKSDIDKIIASHILKCEKKIQIHEKDLKQLANKDNLRLYGELLTANAYKNFGECDFILLENYYEDNKKIKIDIDKNLTLIENANIYFKKYNKAKRKEKALIEQIEKNKTDLEYFKSVEMNLKLCDSESDINNIREELFEQRIIKKRKSLAKKNLPLHLVDRGFDIYVGKNNLQNDYLTFKFANRNDIWLHVKNMPSAHVIIRVSQKDISEDIIFYAANLCVFYSRARDLKNVEVDYTQKKFVNKMPGARPGMVVYKNYKTICVSLNINLIDKLNKLKRDENFD